MARNLWELPGILFGQWRSRMDSVLLFSAVTARPGTTPTQASPGPARTKTFFFISVGHIDRVASGPGAPHRGAGARGRGPGARGRGAELGRGRVEVASRDRRGP